LTWVLNLAVITACALLASRAVGRLAQTYIPVTAGERIAAGLSRDGAVARPAAVRDIDAVIERNIFCSTCRPRRPAATPPAREPGPADTTLTHTTLDLWLVATLVSEEPLIEGSYAAIRDKDGNTALYGVGSRLLGAMVVGIRERRVLLWNEGRMEVLALIRPLEPSRPATAARNVLPPALPGLANIARGIRKVGGGRYEVRRGALNAVLAKPHLVASGGQVIPMVRSGKQVGIRLRKIRVGSVYSLLGMFDGDTITAINGHALSSPEVILNIYTKLRHASHVSIAFERRGKPLSHDYTIR
jgi:general secretion pathway protein C